jgi:hypothetical protein
MFQRKETKRWQQKLKSVLDYLSLNDTTSIAQFLLQTTITVVNLPSNCMK